MLYHLYELNRAALSSARAAADACRLLFRNPLNPAAHTPLGKSAAAALELFERTTRRYRKPAWGIDTIEVRGREAAVRERVVLSKPFCNLVHFERDLSRWRPRSDPKVLVVAPMAGHFATLLRGTVETFLPDHDVYITDWHNARDVGLWHGRFGFDEYVDHLIRFLEVLGPGAHVIAVCQPCVQTMAAAAVMAQAANPCQPRSMTLMAGPIDTRINPTKVNELAMGRPIQWFRNNLIAEVPARYPGAGRKVYPGFVQLAAFMSTSVALPPSS